MEVIDGDAGADRHSVGFDKQLAARPDGWSPRFHRWRAAPEFTNVDDRRV